MISINNLFDMVCTEAHEMIDEDEQPRRNEKMLTKPLDSKVHGTLIKNKDGTEIPPDEFIVFRPADNAVPLLLQYYREILIGQGAQTEQVEAVNRLINRVKDWRSQHPERCKVADVAPGELRE